MTEQEAATAAQVAHTHESAEALARLVAGLLEADLIGVDEWMAFAVDELMRAADAPPWLAELATTHSVTEALELLIHAGGEPTVPERLGCVFLACADGATSRFDVLDWALEVAGGWDTGGGFIPFQPELMALLRRPVPDAAAAEQLEHDVDALLEPLAASIVSRLAGSVRLRGTAVGAG